MTRTITWASLAMGFAAAACSGSGAQPTTRPFAAPGGFSSAGTAALVPMQAPPPIPSAGIGAIDNSGRGLLPPAAPEVMQSPGRCNQDVDIVFVLDVSGSMAPPLTKLESEVALVDQALLTKNLPGPAHYGLVIFVDDVQIMNSGAPYMTLSQLKAELGNQAMLAMNDSARQVMMGGTPNFSWPENSLDALYTAAQQFKWRPDGKTLRTIIHITDASFWDGMKVSSGADSEAPIQGFDTGSMHSYDDTIKALRAQKIWVNTFSAHTGGPPDGMTSPPSHGQFRGTSVNVGIGFFEPYSGKPSIAMATGGFAWDIDGVYDGKISLATPINMSIEAHECAQYPLN